MKVRVILAAAALGLGVVTMSSAQQQTAGIPAKQAGEKSELRGKLAMLRAELELRELEHVADSAVLADALKTARQVDSDSGQAALADINIVLRMDAIVRSGAADGLEKLTELKTAEGRTEIEKGVKETVKNNRAELDRLRNAFVKTTTELNIRRLELAEAETRYSEAK